MIREPNPLLQPLRIPAGWVVEYNQFFEIDPSPEDDLQLMDFTEDLLQISGKIRPILLDLGWYPSGSGAGQYRLVAIKRYADADKMSGSWDRPLRVLTTRSRMEVVEAIERWLASFVLQHDEAGGD